MRTFWLSFVDPDKPVGEKFLGVCVVDVTPEDADAEVPQLKRDFPRHQPGAEWIAAATRRAWRLGCNPGGEVGVGDITGSPEAAMAPRDRLMQKPELIERDLIEAD